MANYICICYKGFIGRNCDRDIDDCVGNLCYNGGICIDLVDGFICFCLLGFIGNICESNLNDCLENVCFNGGFC